MLIKTVISGFGGQGVLFMGYCLATAAMEENYQTTYLPSYGPEVRGGTANCTVAISDEFIASPVASEPDYVVVMNNPSLLRFQAQVESGGILFINRDLVDIEPYRGDITIVKVPVVTLAQTIGNPRGMNVVMLGAILQRTRLLGIESMERVIRKMSLEKNEKLVAPNLLALRTGYEWNSD
jgi:2-oxoglutarate ferredoxin oxidoreductase subunit gamma